MASPELASRGRPMTLAEMIQAECQGRGWTYKALGEATGVTGRFLGDVAINKRSLSVSKAIHLAHKLGQRPGRWIEAVFNRQLAEAGMRGRVRFEER